MLRLSLARAANNAAACRRYLATEQPAQPAKSGKLLLNFVLPHQVIFEETEVERVDVPATSGDMGILANHVATIQQLRPGVIDVVLDGGKSKKYFVAGGFATMNPDNTLNINATEAVLPEQVDKNYLKEHMANAQKSLDRATADAEKALFAAELEVYQALEKFVP